MNPNAPIGIFDSGVGGTSIWKEIHQLLPYENTIYLADSKYAPYGTKTPKEIIELSMKNTEVLLKMDCKIIVVACNTATTNAISALRSKYSVPFVGIEPAIKPAALKSQSKSIGILATKGTLGSALFHQTSELFASDISVIEIVGEGLVPIIENGDLESPQLAELLKTYLRPMIEANIDYLVLGCSHYPYLIPKLLELLPASVKIIDSGEAVALQTRKMLERDRLLKVEKSKPTFVFYNNLRIDTTKSLLADYRDTIDVSFLDF